MSASPVFSTVSSKLAAATVEVQVAAAELASLGHHVVESAKVQEAAVVQRCLAALESSKAVLATVGDTASGLSTSFQDSAPVKGVLAARERASAAVSDAAIALQVRDF